MNRARPRNVPPEALLPFVLASAARQKAARKACRSARAAARRRQALAHTGQQAPPTPTTYSPTQHTGMRGEHAAKAYLQDQGLTILGQNLRARTGEIDLAADEAGVLVFIEVRLRNSASHGGAAASVDCAKQRKLVRTAQAWLPALIARHYQGQMPPCRFDVVSLEGGALTWVRDAFQTES